jgi:hypothetical protein
MVGSKNHWKLTLYMTCKYEILKIDTLLRLFVFVLFLGFFGMLCSAQTLKVVNMERAILDLTASTEPHLDKDMKPAALIKVQLPEKGASFENTYLLPDSINYKEGEYMVYMAAGAKKLKVKFPQCLPIEILFSDYGINSLSGKSTYVLKVVVVRESRPTSSFVLGAGFNVMPFLGPSINLGFMFKNFCVEAGAVYGLNKSADVYIYDKAGALVDGYNYKAMRGFLHVGYDIWAAPVFAVTPQLGAAFNIISGSRLNDITASEKVMDGATAMSGTVGVRLMFAPSGASGAFRLFLTPEYDFAISKDKNFEVLSDSDSKIKSWADGLNVNVGLVFYF